MSNPGFANRPFKNGMNVTEQEQEKIKTVARLLRGSRNILFITGAGISADSGLPTYRGIGGLYNEDTTDDGIPIEIALGSETLKERPAVTWKYLSQIEQRCRGARYNRAHEIIAQMEQVFPRVWVLTQNIDGFHHQAGSKNVIDIHGNMYRLLCESCGWHTSIKDFSSIRIPPECPRCKSVVRPDVVFFGELLPYEKLQLLFKEVTTGFDIYFSIGTTSVFPYIQEPLLQAKKHGKPTVEINPSETEVSRLVDIKLALGAAQALDAIWQEYKSA